MVKDGNSTKMFCNLAKFWINMYRREVGPTMALLQNLEIK